MKCKPKSDQLRKTDPRGIWKALQEHPTLLAQLDPVDLAVYLADEKLTAEVVATFRELIMAEKTP